MKAEEVLTRALREAGIEATIVKKNIVSNEMAVADKFVGSPSIRINGRDVDPAARESTAYSRMCRIYWIKDGFLGWPSRGMLEAGIEAALKEER